MPDKKAIPALEDFISRSIRVRVNSYLNSRNMTKAELAKRTRIAPATINRLTSHDTMPSLRAVIMLSLVMGVSVDKLCGVDMIRERMKSNGNGR